MWLDIHFPFPIHMLPISQRCLSQLLWLTNGSMDYLRAKQVCSSHKNERMNSQTALRLHWEECLDDCLRCMKAKSYWVARKDEWRKMHRWEWNGEMGWMDGDFRCFTWLMLSRTGCQSLVVPDAGLMADKSRSYLLFRCVGVPWALRYWVLSTKVKSKQNTNRWFTCSHTQTFARVGRETVPYACGALGGSEGPCWRAGYRPESSAWRRGSSRSCHWMTDVIILIIRVFYLVCLLMLLI